MKLPIYIICACIALPITGLLGCSGDEPAPTKAASVEKQKPFKQEASRSLPPPADKANVAPQKSTEALIEPLPEWKDANKLAELTAEKRVKIESGDTDEAEKAIAALVAEGMKLVESVPPDYKKRKKVNEVIWRLRSIVEAPVFTTKGKEAVEIKVMMDGLEREIASLQAAIEAAKAGPDAPEATPVQKKKDYALPLSEWSTASYLKQIAEAREQMPNLDEEQAQKAIERLHWGAKELIKTTPRELRTNSAFTEAAAKLDLFIASDDYMAEGRSKAEIDLMLRDLKALVDDMARLR